MIQLYNEDCMTAMEKMPDNAFDLAIVDPPYGSIDAIGKSDCINTQKQSAKRKKYKLFQHISPHKKYFDELKRVSKNWIIWGGNFFDITGGVIAWNKYGTVFGEGEIAICSTHNSVRFFNYKWNGMWQENMKNKEQRIHPTQKPVALYVWLLDKYAKKGDRILDTHLGSGSSAIAAHDMDFDFVGYELDKDYFAAAQERLHEHQKQLKLFVG